MSPCQASAVRAAPLPQGRQCCLLKFSFTTITNTSTWCLQGSPTGRLLAFSPQTGETNVLAQGLWYSNGVALSQDGGSLVVAETCSMTLHRHWLRGPKVSGMPAASMLMSCVASRWPARFCGRFLLTGQQCMSHVQAGKTEVLLRGLPGFPDGVSLASDGNFWVSMPSPTVPVVKLLSSR